MKASSISMLTICVAICYNKNGKRSSAYSGWSGSNKKTWPTQWWQTGQHYKVMTSKWFHFDGWSLGTRIIVQTQLWHWYSKQVVRFLLLMSEYTNPQLQCVALRVELPSPWEQAIRWWFFDEYYTSRLS